MTTMTEPVTSDLSQFGFREKKIAAELLAAYVASPDILGDGVQVMFNPNSGYVFLTDEDFNVAVVLGGELHPFLTCGECGAEGTADDFTGDDEHKPGDYHHVHHVEDGECATCGEEI